jgi:bifunctional N-acetylglucosamine-1-phosphate-uridyltransferase/glucosamine-1-phosphate-acetyltransferase GlmU-like protein
MTPPPDFAALWAQLDRQRAEAGFLSLAATLDLIARGNTIFDPASTLIGAAVTLGTGNVLYPGVVIETRDGGTVSLGDRNVCATGTRIIAVGGAITIGSDNEFGDGGATLRVEGAGETLTIGDGGRYGGGAQLGGGSDLGSGSQVLGPITVRGCALGAGASYRHPDPDERGGVLKGVGMARGLTVARGEVVSTRPEFAQARIERQRDHH